MIPAILGAFLLIGTTPPESDQPYGMRVILFNQGLPDPTLPDNLNKPQPIRRRDGDQLTVGTAEYDGKLTFRTIPSPSHAKIRFMLSATGWTELTTYRGNLVVSSQYSSTVEAGSLLTILPHGVNPDPLDVRVCARTECVHVEPCRRRLFSPVVTRLASRVLDNKRDELAQKVAQSTVGRFHTSLDGNVGKLMTKLNGLVTEGLTKFKKVGVNPRLCSSSTAEHAEIHVCMDGLTDWKAPPFPSVRRGLQISVNEEALTLYSDLLGGKGMHLADVEKTLKSWVQNPFPHKDGNEPIDSVKLAKKKPIAVRFDNGLIHFNLRAEKVYRGERLLDGIKMEAKYQPQLQGKGVRFVRVGKVAINLLDPPPKGQMTLQQFTRLEMMRRSFPKMLPTQLVLNPERFGANGAATRVECDKGWLTIQIETTAK